MALVDDVEPRCDHHGSFESVAHPPRSVRRFRGVTSVLRFAPVLRYSTVTALRTTDVLVGKERRGG